MYHETKERGQLTRSSHLFRAILGGRIDSSLHISALEKLLAETEQRKVGRVTFRAPPSLGYFFLLLSFFPLAALLGSLGRSVGDFGPVQGGGRETESEIQTQLSLSKRAGGRG